MTKQQLLHGPAHYQIKVKGCLDKNWCHCFNGLTITSEGGFTTIDGELLDQAELHAMLTRIRDYGIPLISVTRVDYNQNDSN